MFVAEIFFGPEHEQHIDDVDDTTLVLDYGSDEAVHVAGRVWCVICGGCYASCALFLASPCCRDIISVVDVACASTKVESCEKQQQQLCTGVWVRW